MTFNYVVRQGNVSPGGYDYSWEPRHVRGANKYGVVLLHGASGTSDFDVVGVGWPAVNQLASILADEGIPVIAAYMDGNHFSKDAVTGPGGYIDDAIAFQAATTGCSPDKAHVFGLSMGGGAALRFGSLVPDHAATIGGLVPGVSIEHAYTDNPNNFLTNGFPQLIAGGLGLTYRAVTDGVTNSTTTLTSATANFTNDDVGSQLTRAYNNTGGIPADTTILSVTNSTTVVMDKAATATANDVGVGIGEPLPMTGPEGFDLIGVHAPRVATAQIPNRWYYATNDPYVYTQDVLDAAENAGGEAISVGATGHTNAAAVAMGDHNGSEFSDFVAWLKDNGA
jgi:pimeloyl-ACP methyl ester carboxylesterase